MEIINNIEQQDQVGGWWCIAVCAGACFVEPVLIAVGVAADAVL